MSQQTLLDVDPHVRREGDFYETPAWMTRALLRRLTITAPVLEPCAGQGAISRVLRASGLTVYENEPYQPYETPTRLDMTRRESWQQMPEVGWVISNPPFNLADQIVPLALEHVFRSAVQGGLGVAMVLRLSWLEPTEARAAFLAKWPPTGLIPMPRHDFRGNGSTDSVISAWFLWGAAVPVIDVVTKQERDALIASGGTA